MISLLLFVMFRLGTTPEVLASHSEKSFGEGINEGFVQSAVHLEMTAKNLMTETKGGTKTVMSFCFLYSTDKNLSQKKEEQ